MPRWVLRLAPHSGQGPSLQSGDVHPVEAAPQVEARREDDGVDVVACAVGGDHPGALYPFDRRGDEVDVWASEGGPVIVREQHPLAAQRITRCQCIPGRRVGDLTLEPLHGLGFDESSGPAQSPEAEHPRLQPDIGAPSLDPLDERHTGVGLRPSARPDPVVALEDPRRGALKDHEVADPAGDGGDQLDRRCTGDDDGNPSTVQVVVRRPVGGV